MAGDVLAVDPGVHRVKVGVLWDRTTREAALTGTFLPDENRRLVARLGGFLRKKVAVQWREVPPSSPVPSRAAP